MVAPSTAPVPSFGLVLVRVTTGLVMLVAGWSKLQGGFNAGHVTEDAARWAGAPGPLALVGEKLVLVHPGTFAMLATWGELVLGLLLFLGLLTRPAGFFAAVLYTGAWVVVDPEVRPLVLLIVTCAIGCAISRAGHSAGADVFLAPKLPWWISWTGG
jgi:uncharacterized membrane protein YphA (DoxX/SURF4 family)